MRKNLDLFMNKPDTKIVILTLTNQCNLNCVYCYEHNKELRTMPVETALEIVEREMTMDDGSHFVCVYYFGGEPFLQFETIRQIHGYLKSRTWSKGWFGFSTTNGTLVHNEIQDWLRENSSSVEVYLSIDGDREMQNRNRSNSFDLIDIPFFAREFPFAKMTVTEGTLPSLSKGVIGLHEMGFEVSANLGQGIPWSRDCADVFARQLQILMDYYIAHPEVKPATVLNLPILDLEPHAKQPRRFCGIGPLMRSYDVDGKAYPCHAFAPLSIGAEAAEKARKLDFSCPLQWQELDEKCRECPVVGYCPTCYGINFGASGNVYRIREDHCRMMKIQFLANAMFRYQQYRLGRLDLTAEQELKLLRNIKAVQTLEP